MRAARRLRPVAAVAAVAATLVTMGVGPAHGAAPSQAASGTDVAKFIRSDWWPQTKDELRFPAPTLKKVVCPRSVPATDADPETVVRAALVDLAGGDVAPSVDSSSGVFACVGRLDGQPLLIAGALNEAGDARFATASLILQPDQLAGLVAGAFADQVGGRADVVCSTRSVIVAQPDIPVRCKVAAADGTKSKGNVVLDGNARVVSVDFVRK
ncbi:MAG: hypothetical protein FJW95_05365 [Actinobacteria bacterium]|nr:hypothetical protein [Actinomycetota bacterium]